MIKVDKSSKTKTKKEWDRFVKKGKMSKVLSYPKGKIKQNKNTRNQSIIKVPFKL